MTDISQLTPDRIDEDMPLDVARKRYAHLLTDDEKKSFDEIDKDSFIEVEKYFASLKTDDDILKELTGYWVGFLRLNEDYETYCLAQRQNDVQSIANLAQRYPAGEHIGIAQLFNDWGDIHADGWSFDEWLAPRRNLFFPPEKAIGYADQNQDAASAGRVLVSLPKGIKDKQELWTLFSQFCNTHYLPDHAGYAPTYQINGRPSVSLLQKLEMAIMVDDFFLYDDVEQEKKRDREYSHAQVVKSIMFNPLLRYRYGLGKVWQDDASALAPNAKNGNIRLTDSALVSKKPYIVDLENFFDNCVEQAIYGVFPAR
jgi:hypothetical protein